MDVSLEDLYNKKTVTVNYKQQCYCKNCNGYGTKDGKESKCSTCNGTGQARITRRIGNMIQQIVRTCGDCNGSGQRADSNNICESCAGKKYKLKNKSMEFELNPKLSDGDNITIKEKGNIYRDVKTNLIISIREKQHSVFTRIGNDLHMKLNIKLYQLLFGINKCITHLDGRKLFINISKLSYDSIDDDILYSVNNEGIESNGNLILHIMIDKLNMDVLQDNEKTVLKKLLVKCDIDEFKREVGILKDKDNLIKTSVKKYTLNQENVRKESNHRHQRQHFETDEGPADCVTQ